MASHNSSQPSPDGSSPTSYNKVNDGPSSSSSSLSAPPTQEEEKQPPKQPRLPPSSPTSIVKPIASWSVEEVGQWMRSLGVRYAQYVEGFAERHIDGQDFLALTDKALQRIVPDDLDRELLLNKLRTLKEKQGQQAAINQAFPDIKEEEITWEESLGSGQFGEVRRAQWRGATVAVKVQHDQSPENIAKLFEETSKLARACNHPHVIRLIGFCSKKGALITEFAAHGSAEDVLVKKKMFMGKYDVLTVLQIAVDAAAGLLHLHKQPDPIIHRDVAARNILLDESYRGKIGDFGMAKELPEQYQAVGKVYDKFKEAVVPLKWVAPEFFDKGTYSKATDVYMFGITLWELFAHAEPYDNMDDRSAMNEARKGARPDKPPIELCPESVWQVINKCWAPKDTARPSIDIVLRDLIRIKQQEEQRVKKEKEDAAVAEAKIQLEQAESQKRAQQEREAELERLKNEVEVLKKEKGDAEKKAQSELKNLESEVQKAQDEAKRAIDALEKLKRGRNKTRFVEKPEKGIIGGKESNNKGEFNKPWGVCFDAKNQRIIVSDGNNHRVELFDTNGKFVTMFGAYGSEKGQLNYPRGICIQPVTNNIIVTEGSSHRLQIFNNSDDAKEFKVLNTIGLPQQSQDEGKFNHPFGVTCNNRGHILVADRENHRIQILDEKGCFIRLMGTTGKAGPSNHQFSYPFDVYMDNNRNQIMVADHSNNRISIWSNDGSQFIKAIPRKYPYCLTIDHYNRLIVGFSDCIEVYELTNNDYKRIQTLGKDGSHPGEFGEVRGLCATDDNTLVVSDCGNDRIQMF